MTKNLTLEITKNPKIKWKSFSLESPPYSTKISVPSEIESILPIVCSNLQSALEDFDDHPRLLENLKKCFGIFIHHFSNSFFTTFYMSEKDFGFGFKIDDEYCEFFLYFKTSEPILEIKLQN